MFLKSETNFETDPKKSNASYTSQLECSYVQEKEKIEKR